MKPLVSILIPAYNAGLWIAQTIESAIAQTWERKEIIIVDDGSTDQTLSVARQFAAKNLTVLSQPNQGAAAARNKAYAASQGDFIQWLDADDLLAPNKMERQMQASLQCGTKRTLLSGPWGHFLYRAHKADFAPTPLWRDLAPVEWLLLKMGQNLHMQPATWLVRRELAEAAGPWDVRLSLDDDGEYFCRVLLASDGSHFVPEARTFYRRSGFGSLSNMDCSDKKLESQFLSMQLHVRYLRSLEETSRVQAACLKYLQTWFGFFYPDRPDLVSRLQALAAELGGHLEVPEVSWKYAWLRPLFGWDTTKRAQYVVPRLRAALVRSWDKACFQLDKKRSKIITYGY